MKRAPKRKPTPVEKLLAAVRRNPSPKSRDPRQLDLMTFVADHQKRDAFARLDETIRETLKDTRRNGEETP